MDTLAIILVILILLVIAWAVIKRGGYSRGSHDYYDTDRDSTWFSWFSSNDDSSSGDGDSSSCGSSCGGGGCGGE